MVDSKTFYEAPIQMYLDAAGARRHYERKVMNTSTRVLEVVARVHPAYFIVASGSNVNIFPVYSLCVILVLCFVLFSVAQLIQRCFITKPCRKDRAHQHKQQRCLGDCRLPVRVVVCFVLLCNGFSPVSVAVSLLRERKFVVLTVIQESLPRTTLHAV